MQPVPTARGPRRGLTVLGLLLLIIALVVAAVLLIRYLRSRPAAASVSLTHQTFDQLDLPGVIQVVRGDAVDLLYVPPHPLG